MYLWYLHCYIRLFLFTNETELVGYEKYLIIPGFQLRNLDIRTEGTTNIPSWWTFTCCLNYFEESLQYKLKTITVKTNCNRCILIIYKIVNLRKLGEVHYVIQSTSEFCDVIDILQKLILKQHQEHQGCLNFTTTAQKPDARHVFYPVIYREM